MSKYITHFQTESAYRTALPTMELPNVSLVDELGEVHYHRALYGAHAGDICLYDVAEGQKIVVTANNWNLTTYPTASYPIIGIVVADESVSGCAVIHTLLSTIDGQETTTDENFSWQDTVFNWGLPNISTLEGVATELNGKTNTATILSAINTYDQSHSTDNITGFIGQVLQSFAPTGTNAGDWYVPAIGQCKQLYTNKNILKATANKINSANSSLSLTGTSLFAPLYSDFISSSQGSNSSNISKYFPTGQNESGAFNFSSSKSNKYKLRLFINI